MVENVAQREASQFTYSAQIPGGAYITRKLKEGDTVSVGSDDTADLRLNSPGIAGMHCLLTIEEGRLCIKDCYSPSGTFVNGERIQDIKLKTGCRLKLAEVEIEIKNNNEPLPPSLNTFRQPVPQKPEIVTEPEQSQEVAHDDHEVVVPEAEQVDVNIEEVVSEFSREPTAEVARLLYELEESKTENEVLQERLKSLPKQNSEQSTGDPFQTEMLDLMKQEIEALQQELEKRNSQDFTFDLNSESLPGEQLPGREEVENLVDRLEDLLDELQQKDEQIQVLQDLVLASDSANQAEQEEREQLAKWLGEFEERFEFMAEEWQAENDHLKGQVERLEQERIEAVAALSADSDSVKSETLKRMTDSLRNDLSNHQDEINQLKSTITELNGKIKDAQHASPREEEIRLARERAEIARMRHDLEVRLHKIEKTAGETGVVEQKLKSLTDQLREPSKNEKANSSLSGRFLSLWGRLNG